jgi:hypothetical protein
MGNIFSQSHLNDPSANPSSSSLGNSTASAAALKQTIAQNMRLSKSKVSSLLKANHMNYSIVHRNHFYDTLPHVSPSPQRIRSLAAIELTCRSTLERPTYLGLHLSAYSKFTMENVKR